MAKKNKIRIDRLIIVILVCLLIIAGLGFGVFKLIDLLTSKKSTTNDTKPAITETTSGVKITKEDYNIYFDDTGNLGFNFIVAELCFEANEPVNFEFKNLQTSEKVSLDNISDYVKQMQQKGYDFNKLGINTTGITSTEKKVKAKVFIPYKSDASSLALYNAIDSSKIEFDLSKTPIAAITLKLNDENKNVESGSTTVSVTKAYISDRMRHNGESYSLGSSQQIYSFEISVLESQENVQITDAIFKADNNNDDVHCFPKDYDSSDMQNIVNKNLTSGLKGGLFFEINSSDDKIHDGILLIKFSNNEKWVEIPTKQ